MSNSTVKTDLSSLDKIASGEITVSAAAELLKRNLQELSEKKAQKIYTVLRAWVWKTLNERRRDDELRKWHSLISLTSARLEIDYTDHAARIQVLHELVYESISARQVYSYDVLARRSHVKEILVYIYRSPEQQLARRELQMRLGLKDSNLTRVMSMLSDAGLVERSARGKTAIYSLTISGRARAKVVASSNRMVRSELYSDDVVAGRSRSNVRDQRHYTVRFSITNALPELEDRPVELIKSGLQPREKAGRDTLYAMVNRDSTHE